MGDVGRIVGGESDDIVPAAIGGDAARPGQSHESPLSQPRQVPGIQRGVGCDDYHTGAVHWILQFITEFKLPELLSYGGAIDGQHAAKIRLHQYPDCVAAQRCR